MSSYHKFSIIGGYNAAGEYENVARAGHWKPKHALALARQMKLVAFTHLSLQTYDLSGRGRSGEDRRIQLI